MGLPVEGHSGSIIFRAGSSINAKSNGTIPSPLTESFVFPSNGRYELAATNSSMLVVIKLPEKEELHKQVTSMPRSVTRVSDEHSDVSATSRSKPRV